MTVVFSCVSNYTIFISYLLTKNIYKNDYNILITNDILVDQETINRIKRIKVWDEVIYVKENNFDNDLEKLKEKTIDRVHLYTFGCGSFTSCLVKMLYNKNTDFILTEEGTALWELDTKLKYIRNCGLTENELINRIKEVWAFEDRLVESKHKINLKKIKIDYLIKNESIKQLYLKDLNYIFNYVDEDLDGRLIFFDENFAQAGMISRGDELALNNAIVSTFDKVIIKPHPNDYKYKYYNLNEEYIINNKDVPWEIIYLNKYNELETSNTIILTTGSSIMFNMKILNNESKIKCIAIGNMIIDLIDPKYKKDMRIISKLSKKFNSLYGNVVLIPNSIKEYENILNSFNLLNETNLINKYWGIYSEDKKKKNSNCLEKTLATDGSFTFSRTVYMLQKKYKNNHIRYCVWGTGTSAEMTINELNRLNFKGNLIAAIDNFKSGHFQNVPIFKENYIKNLKYDMIFICTSISKEKTEKFLLDQQFKYGENYVYGYNI